MKRLILAFVAAFSAQANATNITGSIDDVWGQDGNFYIGGWACQTGDDEPIGVHLYAGGMAGSGTFVKGAAANLPSESAVAAFCSSTGTAHRFNIALTYDELSNFENQTIYIHGISNAGTDNLLLSRSGQHIFPSPNSSTVTGNIDGVTNSTINGWACQTHMDNSLDVHLYVGNPITRGGIFLKAATANLYSEPDVAAACGSSGGQYRFSIPLSDEEIRNYACQNIYVYGLSPLNTGNPAIFGSGTYAVPSPFHNVNCGATTNASVNDTFFAWSATGPIDGMYCTQTNEPSEPSSHSWYDNYFCASRNLGIQWSAAGKLTGKQCTQIEENADPDTWLDNYLCLPADSKYSFYWNSAGQHKDNTVQWIESNDPHSWADNYLSISHVPNDLISIGGSYTNETANRNDQSIIEEIITNSDFYCPLLNFAHILGYGWAGCLNPTVIQESEDYVITSPYGNGYWGHLPLKTRISDIKLAVEADTFNLGEYVYYEPEAKNTSTAWLTNKSDIEVTQELVINKSIENCWSRTDEFSFGQSISVTVDFKPIFGGVTVSTTTGVTMGQMFSETKSGCKMTSYQSSVTVPVPANSKKMVTTTAFDTETQIPYTAYTHLDYNVTFDNFLRLGGNAHVSHPTDRPHVAFTFGDTSGLSAPIAIKESFEQRKGVNPDWDWDWIFGNYGTKTTSSILNSIMNMHRSKITGYYMLSSVDFHSTVGPAIPIHD